MKNNMSNHQLSRYVVIIFIGVIGIFLLNLLVINLIESKPGVIGNIIEENDNTNLDNNNEFNEAIPEINNSNPDYETIAYSSKMHYSKMPIKYYIYSPLDNDNENSYTKCSQIKEYNFKEAILKFEEQTNNSVRFQEITFEEKTENPELIEDNTIHVTCNNYKTDEGYIIPGEAYYSLRGNTIVNGYIDLYHNGLDTRDFIGVELHELLHSFGYSHIEDKPSIMNPIVSGLNKIDEDIVKELIDVYS